MEDLKLLMMFSGFVCAFSYPEHTVCTSVSDNYLEQGFIASSLHAFTHTL